MKNGYIVIANDMLLNKKITSVKYMSSNEADEFGRQASVLEGEFSKLVEMPFGLK